MKKKILIYNGQLFMGGIERILITYLNELSKRDDIEVELLIKEDNPVRNVFYKEIPKGMKVTFIKTEKMTQKRENYSKKRKIFFYKLLYNGYRTYERSYMKKWLKKFLEKRQDIDVVIDFDMSLKKYLDVVPQKKIGWIHYSLEARKGGKRRRFEKKLPFYDRMVVICDEMKEEMKRIHSSSYNKTVRIYNPFNLEQIRIKADDLAEFSSEEKKLLEEEYLISVSRLTPSKGQRELVKAYKELKKLGIREKFYILGDGKDRQALENLIKELELEEDVFLLGQKQNPYPWMKNAKVFVHASDGEGLPTVFVESMICGTPVIAYDCPTGPKEILGDGRYGGLIKYGDFERLVEEIYEVLTKQEKLEKYEVLLDKRVDEFSYGNSLKTLIDTVNSIS